MMFMVEDFWGTQKCHANLRLFLENGFVTINDTCVGDGSPLNSFKIMLKYTAETKINNWRGLFCLMDTRKQSSLSHIICFVVLIK